MKKLLGIFLAALLCMMLVVAVSAADVYVNDGGTGDGSSASAPLGNMTEAINKIGADGGKVIIVDTYTCSEEYYEPEHAGDIVITGGTYVFSQGQYNRWFLAGPGSTTFENIIFTYGAGNTNLIVAQYNKLIMGEGIVAEGTKMYVVGGYQLPLMDTAEFEKDSDVTIKSGKYWAVAGHSRGSGEYSFSGTAHITVEGGEIATLYGASINGNYSGSAVININGGIIENLRTAGDKARRLDGDCTVNINGGQITLLSINNVMGKTTVNFQGGSVANAEKTVEAAIQMFVMDGTATLNAHPSVDAKIISLFFDEVNTLGGVAGTTPAATEPPATPAETTAVPTETTAAPAETTVASVETTAAPVETTVAPIETTAAPVETTVAPIETTAAPVETTAAPVETTAAPAQTTAAPVAPTEEGGAPVGLIIGVAAAVIVVAAVVIVVLKKKK